MGNASVALEVLLIRNRIKAISRVRPYYWRMQCALALALARLQSALPGTRDTAHYRTAIANAADSRDSSRVFVSLGRST